MTKLLFLPHCLNDKQKQIITEKAKEKNFEVHVVGGGSIVKKILQEYKDKKIDHVLGVACKDELKLATGYTKSLKEKGTNIQIVELLKDGCKNTEVDLNKVFAKLK